MDNILFNSTQNVGYNSINNIPDIESSSSSSSSSSPDRNNHHNFPPFMRNSVISEEGSMARSISEFRNTCVNKQFMPSLNDIDEITQTETREEFHWRWLFFGVPILYTYTLLLISAVRIISGSTDGMTNIVFWFGFGLIVAIIGYYFTTRWLKNHRPTFHKWYTERHLGKVYSEEHDRLIP
jgi:hypothetical protein